VYLSGGNTPPHPRCPAAALKNAPPSKSAVSRIVDTLRGDWESWREQSLKNLNVVYLYLDAIALRVRSAGR
jgi:transposase-like protein